MKPVGSFPVAIVGDFDASRPTLFVPQLTSAAQRPHPLLTAFVAAMMEHAGRRPA